jgi:hypothetical protein
MKMIHIVIWINNMSMRLAKKVFRYALQGRLQAIEEENEPVQKNILLDAGIPESQGIANKNPVRVSFGWR